MKVKPVRWRRGILLLALLTPLFTMVISVASIDNSAGRDSETGQPNLTAAIVNNDSLSLTDPHLADSGLAGRVLVGELVTAKNSGFSWDITNTETAQVGLKDGTYAAVVTIPENFTAAYISSTTANPVQAMLKIQTDGSQSYLAALLARSLASNLQQSISTGLTKTFVDTLLISISGIGAGLGDIGEGANALTGGLSAMSSLAAELPGLTTDLADGSKLVSDGIYALGDALWSVGEFNNQVVKNSGALVTDINALRVYVTAMPDSPDKTHLLLALDALELNATSVTVQAIESGVAVDAGALAADVIGEGSSLVSDGTQLLADGMPLFSEGLAGATEGAGLLASGLTAASDALPKYSLDQASTLADVIAQPVVSNVEVSPALPGPQAAITAFAAPIALWLGALVLALIYAPFDKKALGTRASSARIVWGASFPPIVMAILQGLLVIAGAWALGVVGVHQIAFAVLMLIAAISFVLLHQGLVAIAGKSAWLASIALLGLQVIAAGVILPAHYLPDWVQSIGAVLPLSQAISASQILITGGTFTVGVMSVFWLVLTAIIGITLISVGVFKGRRSLYGHLVQQ